MKGAEQPSSNFDFVEPSGIDPLVAPMYAFAARYVLVVGTSCLLALFAAGLLALIGDEPLAIAAAIILVAVGLALGALAAYWSLTMDWAGRAAAGASLILSLVVFGIAIHLHHPT